MWKNEVKVKHLFTKEEDLESVQKSMNAVADELKKSGCFIRFSIEQFRSIPAGDDVFGPVDYANRLLNEMYDYADRNRIWIE